MRGRSPLPAGARGFLPRLLLWFPLLLLLWFPLGAGYRTALLGAGNAVFAALGPGREILFLHHTQWAAIGVTDRADMAVLVRDPAWPEDHGQKQHVLAKAICTFQQPFAALAFLLALLLASRISWRARLGKGVVALIVLHLAMLAAVAVDVSHAARSLGPPANPADWLPILTAMLHFSVTDWPAGVFIVPLLCWILTCGLRAPWRNPAGQMKPEFHPARLQERGRRSLLGP
jgi:hypothetical protein